MAFAGHPYGRPANGTPESIAEDHARRSGRAMRSRTFAKDTLRVVVVGDIDAKTLAGMLDTGVRQLPAKAKLTPVAQIEPDGRREAEGDRDGGAAVGRPLRPARHAAQGQGLPARVRAQHRSSAAASCRRGCGRRCARSAASPTRSTPPCSPSSTPRSSPAASPPRTRRSASRSSVIRAELKRIADEGPTETELRERQELSDRLVRAALRHQRQDRQPAAVDPAGGPGLGLRRPPQRRDRGGDARADVKRVGQAPVRGPGADRHHRRQAQGPGGPAAAPASDSWMSSRNARSAVSGDPIGMTWRGNSR